MYCGFFKKFFKEFYFIVDAYNLGDDGPYCTEKPVLHLVVNISVE
jgi:hypothetical protein